ncbi:hypothetical protein [Psychrobacillus soli]|uniref:CheW-like domain-containing protein n=1 Tax=Psychrobacillus soli TaxID=1543965 RepID=A0A544TKJ2_9BACI|nr:hypothetical protein [Psychrobacillus soli]TQR17953.1 hypothetical protein FG383_03640 [Psychrobacillus soli]
MIHGQVLPVLDTQQIFFMEQSIVHSKKAVILILNIEGVVSSQGKLVTLINIIEALHSLDNLEQVREV